MPFIRGGSAKVLVGAHDLTGFINNASVSVDSGLVEATVFGELYRDYLESIQMATATVSGFYDNQVWSNSTPLVAGLDDIVSDRSAEDEAASYPQGILAATTTVDATKGYAPITIAWAGNTALNTAFVGAVSSADYETGNDVANLTSFAANFNCAASWETSLGGTKGTTQKSGFSTRGVLLAPLAAYSTAAAAIGSTHDNAASSANGCIINLHGQFIGSSGTCSVRVEHATVLGGPYTTVGTFSNIDTTSGPYGQSLIVSGTINRYVRAYLVTTMTGGQTLAVSYARL